MTRQEVTAAALFLATYAVFIVPMTLWPCDGLLPLLAYGLYAVLALSFAADLTEILLALWWPARVLPEATGAPPRHKVAVLMTVCDDWRTAHLESLGALAQAGYDVFVLDDSDVPASLPQTLCGRARHVRRPARSGAKAGNLNHWLWQHGRSYEYAIVLDADSIMAPACADRLLLAAEHPANARVALFQSKLRPLVNARSILRRALAATAQPRARVLERVHGRLGLVLSSGHNVLLRLAPIRALGGFDELLTNEDTAISLELAAAGWGVALANVWSEDSDPDTVAAYNRRTVRWARQTVELFARPWWGVPLGLKLLLCRHLLNHLFPVLGTSLLVLSLWTGPALASDAASVAAAALGLRGEYVVYGVALWLLLGACGLLVVLRLVLARLEGVPWRAQVLAAAFGGVHYATLIGPLAAGMLASVCGRRVRFVPTNSRRPRSGGGWLGAHAPSAAAAALLVILLIGGAARRPGSLLVGFNALWLACLLVSPIALAVVNCVVRRTWATGTLRTEEKK